MECSTPPVLKLLCFSSSFSVETDKNVRPRIANSKNFLKQRTDLHMKQCTQIKNLTKILHLKES